MNKELTYKEAIDKSLFAEAIELINNGADILKSQWQFKLSDTFAKIIQNKAFDVLNALIEKKHIELDIYEYDSFKDTLFESIVLHLGEDDESLAFLENLIPEVDSLDDSLDDITWLSLAFTNGAATKVIETMLNNGFNINYLNNADETILLQTLTSRHHKLNDTRKKELVKLTIEQGIDVNQANISKTTALHLAVENALTEIAVLLIENGADPNVANKAGKTAYHIAIVDKKNWDIVEKMVENFPPDFHAETGKDRSLLYDYINLIYTPTLSETDKKFIQFFADNGADINRVSTDDYGESSTVINILVKKSFEFFENFLEVFSFNINEADDNGNTILHKVCAFDVNFDQNKAKDTYKKVKFLLKLGADASITNTDDKKAHELAATDNLKEKTVALLIKQ